MALLPVLLLALALPAAAGGQTPDRSDPTPHSDGTLVAELDGIQPGRPFTVGLRITMDRGWHTYWKNAGDSGTPALLDWTLPPGFTADSIQFPRPERIPYPPLMSYAYQDEVLLPVRITPPAELEPGTRVRLEADAEWLICEDICLVAETPVALELPVVSDAPAPTRWAGDFDATRLELPVQDTAWDVSARASGDTIWLRVRPPAPWEGSLAGAYFYPLDSQLIEHAIPEPVRADGDEVWIGMVRSPYRLELPERLVGLLAPAPGQTVDAAGHVALAVDAPLDEGAPPAAAIALAMAPMSTAPAAPEGGGLSLLVALGLAFLGGVLLNLMPCVFPVLSLKILGFVEHAAGDRRVMRTHGAVFGAGVVLSFIALATVLLAVRAAGPEVGWGFQLQSPVIVALLAFLMFGIGLNFLGLLEFGAALTRLGRVGADDSGYRGSFLTGVLAVIVATPCTAPFMGAAIGAALVRPAVEALAIFAGLGVGMAMPYMVLSSWPGLLRRLPKPGRWMETLRQALAFPMFAVAVWLLWVLGLQVGVGSATTLLFALLAFAFGAWLLGRGSGAKPGLRRAGQVVAVAVMAASLAWGVVAVARAEPAASSATGAGELAWEPWTESTVAAHRAQGHAVFVDFTAAWCITCQVNERVVLSSAPVVQAFRDADIALVRADWTRRDDAIARALAVLGRSGVPVYALYPADPAAPPVLLPSVLTSDIVLDALDRLAPARAQE